MLKLPFVRLSTRRYIHPNDIRLASGLKRKLYHLEKHNSVMRKTPKELKRLDERRSIKIKKTLKASYSKPKAYHIIEKSNLESGKIQKGSKFELGPTTDDDLVLLSRNNDKRLLYTVLGISGEQLRDSKLICDDAAKFIKRGQLEKAVFLAKLAKNKGSAAMNLITEHYLNNLQSPKSGLDIYNWRKKIGVPLNEYSNTILFSGIANQKNPVSKKLVESIYNIVDKLIIDGKLNQLEFNAALGALSNCKDVSLAFKLFQKKNSIKGVHYDAISFLWMLRTCSKVKTNSLFIELFNDLVTSIPKRCVDEKLVFEICKVLQKKDKTNASFIKAVDQYFKSAFGKLWDGSLKTSSDISEAIELPQLSTWGIEEKFPLNRHIIGILMDNCVQMGSSRLGIAIYEKMKKNKSNIIDIDMFHSYITLLIEEYPQECVERCLNEIDSLEQSNKHFLSNHTLVLVYRAFMKELSKRKVNRDPARIEKLLGVCHTFISKYDVKYSSALKTNVYSREAWMYVFKIFRGIEVRSIIPLNKEDLILDQFLKTLCSGAFDVDKFNKKDYKSEIFIELEAVRLIKTLSDGYKITDLDLENKGVKSDDFLRRRFLLRLKDKLLLHIKELEDAQRMKKKPEVDVIEWSMKQLATRIRNKDYGRNDAPTKTSDLLVDAVVNSVNI